MPTSCLWAEFSTSPISTTGEEWATARLQLGALHDLCQALCPVANAQDMDARRQTRCRSLGFESASPDDTPCHKGILLEPPPPEKTSHSRSFHHPIGAVV